MFPGCAVPPYSKETKLGSSHQEASPSADENTRVVLVPYSQRIWKIWKVCNGAAIKLAQMLSEFDRTKNWNRFYEGMAD